MGTSKSNSWHIIISLSHCSYREPVGVKSLEVKPLAQSIWPQKRTVKTEDNLDLFCGVKPSTSCLRLDDVPLRSLGEVVKLPLNTYSCSFLTGCNKSISPSASNRLLGLALLAFHCVVTYLIILEGDNFSLVLLDFLPLLSFLSAKSFIFFQ